MLLPAPSGPTSPVMPPAGMVAEMASEATALAKAFGEPPRGEMAQLMGPA